MDVNNIWVEEVLPEAYGKELPTYFVYADCLGFGCRIQKVVERQGVILVIHASQKLTPEEIEKVIQHVFDWHVVLEREG